MKRALHPRAIILVKYNNRGVHPGVLTGVTGFFVLFMIIFGISSLLLSSFTDDVETACSAVISAMSNTGPGFGAIGPASTHAAMPDAAKIYLTVLMLVGRLEVFTVLVLFTRAFWKK